MSLSTSAPLWTALLLAAGGAHGATLHCLVVSVHDGDTLTAQCAGQRHRIRLVEIDAPELRQPYSRLSTNSLKELCLRREAVIDSSGEDRYGRVLGRVHCGGVDANAEQVRRGYAWAFDKYLTDQGIKAIEAEARAGRRGLWRSTDPEPPWEYRARMKISK